MHTSIIYSFIALMTALYTTSPVSFVDYIVPSGSSACPSFSFLMFLSYGECLGTSISNIENIEYKLLYYEAKDTNIDTKGLNREKVNISPPCTTEWRFSIITRHTSGIIVVLQDDKGF